MSDVDPLISKTIPTSKDTKAYRVLARKYRPTTLSGLIGQDFLVRTLTSAFESDRLAHAFILTGVRGVGKTTTARIVARALNCIGPDGSGVPTTEPCGLCSHCISIAEDRHIDILEMDAASRTGVDDIRELIDGVRYRPTSARYKVYIIDEVHMLSKNAFNALLKTLEEPPDHVKFIFATTEIRKVPITVLSRCQRFDLNRVETKELSKHYNRIILKENATISDVALHLISRASDGSVRDGLSLVDQAISQADGEITATQVREMLGLADRSKTFELLKSVLSGAIADALGHFDRQYQDGADPVALFEDLLEITHFLTRIKILPTATDVLDIPEIERTEGKAMASNLSMASLARTWQILLKGLGEVRMAPSQKQAAEMVLVRLAYTANMPTPEEAINKLSKEKPPVPIGATTPSVPVSNPLGNQAMIANGGGGAQAQVTPKPATQLETVIEPQSKSFPVLATFEDVLVLADEMREGKLRTHLISDVRLVNFEQGRIEFSPGPQAPKDLAQSLSAFLKKYSDQRWMVSVSDEKGGNTILEQRKTALEDLQAEVSKEPLVKAVLKIFPDAILDEIIKEDLLMPEIVIGTDDNNVDDFEGLD